MELFDMIRHIIYSNWLSSSQVTATFMMGLFSLYFVGVFWFENQFTLGHMHDLKSEFYT